MEERRVIVKVGERDLVLRTDFFSQDEIDIDQLVRIDLNNIAAEIVTFPSIMNTVAGLLAEAKSKVNRCKLENEIKEAKFKSDIREDYAKKHKGEKPLSNERTDEAMRLLPAWQVLQRQYNEAIYKTEMVEGLYWACKSKDTKLDKLAGRLDGEDMTVQINHNKATFFNYVKIKNIRPATAEEEEE